MNKKPVILIFIDWFSPGYKAGGPIASCVNFIHLMKHNYSLYVFTSDTDLGENDPYQNIIPDKWIKSDNNDCMVYYARQRKLNGRQIKNAIQKINPDFVYLNHIFSPWFVVYPLWLTWKGIIQCKVVVCPRGALYSSALSVKPYKKIPFMRLFKWMGIHKKVRFHATSEREQKAILGYFPGSEVMVADDLPNTQQPVFETIAKMPGILKAVFIARIHPIKNLLFLLTLMSEIKAQVHLTIIGPVEDEAYWKKCSTVIETLPTNTNIEYRGSLPNQAMIALLKDHHLFMLPTKGENFGHSIFESFLAGRPVLISDQTPWQQLKEKQVGWDLPLNKPAEFAAAIETAAAWDQVTFGHWGQHAWHYAKTFIENPDLKKDYLLLFS